MKIGILQCGHLEKNIENKHGSFGDMFRALLSGNDFTYSNYVVIDNQFPASVDECDGWLLTGSVHGAYEKLSWISRLEEFIRSAYKQDVPIAGICFGHQLMALALGGKVEKYSGGWSIGHTQYSLMQDSSAQEELQVDLLALHQDQVVDKPPDARVIASTDFCANAGLAYKGSALSFQPHPEFTPEFMRDLIEHKILLGLSTKTGEAALAEIGDQYDTVKIANQLTQFYKKFAKTCENKQAAE